MAQPQREWFEKDYYKALGVAELATEAEIRRAYRKLAKEHHPDAARAGNGQAANGNGDDRFKEISAAYDVLSDTEKRKQYDEVRRLGAGGGGFGPGGPGAGSASGGPGFGSPGRSGAFTFTTDDVGDMGDVLGGLFSRIRSGTPGGPGPRSSTVAQRGADLETELHLSFNDAVAGVTTTVNVTSEATCSTCHGSGAAPGTSVVACPACEGRGVIDDNQGFFSFSRACPRCAGRGIVVETPCPTCRGRGSEVRPRTVKVRVPPGVDDGQRIRVKGRGGPGRNGGPPGDLFVVVRVARHPVFSRKGRDLLITVPVTFPEAALGAEITVPTLDSPVVLKVPAGTPSGRTYRVKNRGIATPKGTGDLLATIEVAVPASLSPEQREAVEALRETLGTSVRSHLDAL